jgi:hypothetical protein
MKDEEMDTLLYPKRPASPRVKNATKRKSEEESGPTTAPPVGYFEVGKSTEIVLPSLPVQSAAAGLPPMPEHLAPSSLQRAAESTMQQALADFNASSKHPFEDVERPAEDSDPEDNEGLAQGRDGDDEAFDQELDSHLASAQELLKEGSQMGLLKLTGETEDDMDMRNDKRNVDSSEMTDYGMENTIQRKQRRARGDHSKKKNVEPPPPKRTTRRNPEGK